MADVLLAHRRLQREESPAAAKHVALKRLKPELAADPVLRQMLVEEARLGAGLVHPNLVEAFDLGEHDGNYFFTMEFVRGRELRHLVRAAGKSRRSLPLPHVLTIIASIAAGLDYAHHLRTPAGRPLNVVHLDVCPSNVMVGPEGFVKLIDFGIARHDLTPQPVHAGPVVSAPADVALRRGTMAYMSPEQCRGDTTLDRRSDVFSLGILLWELTVWRRLYRADSRAEVFAKIVDRDAPPPSSIRSDYAPGLEAIVMKALARDPAQRFETAGKLLLAVEEFAHGYGIATSTTRLGKYVSSLLPPAQTGHTAPSPIPVRSGSTLPGTPGDSRVTQPYPLVPLAPAGVATGAVGP